jgi:hypothetical protein
LPQLLDRLAEDPAFPTPSDTACEYAAVLGAAKHVHDLHRLVALDRLTPDCCILDQTQVPISDLTDCEHY